MPLKVFLVQIFGDDSFNVIHIGVDHLQNVPVVEVNCYPIVRLRMVDFQARQIYSELLTSLLQQVRPFTVMLLSIR